VNEAVDLLDRKAVMIPAQDQLLGAMADDYLLGFVQRRRPTALRRWIRHLRLSEPLPVVDEVGRNFGQDLSECVLIAVQHLFGSSIRVFSWLHLLGLPYERMHVVAKAYSSHRAVILKLRARGVNVYDVGEIYPGRFSFDSRGYDTVLEHLAEEAVENAIDSLLALGLGRRLLVLDDGATAIEILNTRRHRRHASAVGAVEQTRRGKRRIEKMRSRDRYPFPIVNVADSRLKLTLESPMIGTSVVEQLDSALRRLRDGGTLFDRRLLVIGYGEIGRSVALAARLQGSRCVGVFDLDKAKCNDAEDEGFSVFESIRQALRDSDLVIGCTGNSCIPQTASAYLNKGTILASASSSNVEFMSLGLRPDRLFPWRWKFAFQPDSPFLRVHGDYGTEFGGDVCLLNSGFPINFNGAVDPIRAQDIQLTRALMLAGALQSVTVTGKRVHMVRLNAGWQDQIEQWFTARRR
jgi:hypothetical protein